MSVAWTAGGSLEDGLPLPEKGAAYRLLPMVRERGTHYATEDVAGLVDRASRRVAAAFPRSVLHVGNVSRKNGGPIAWSVSHQAGRDVDLAFYARQGRKPVNALSQLVVYDRRGRARGAGGRLEFDVARNWALVVALLEDPLAQVQWIFVSDPLRRLLIDHARKAGAAAATIARAEAVLRQPSGSGAHNDHFHVRIYCSCEDLLLGCMNGEPVWPWVRTYERALAQRIRRLERRLMNKAPAARLEALEQLRRLQSRGSAAMVARRLGDEQSAVRDGALAWLRAVTPNEAAEHVLPALPGVTDAAFAARLLAVLAETGASTAAPRLEAALAEPSAVFAGLPELDRPSRSKLRVGAAQALATCGGVRSVPGLLPLLRDSDSGVRAAVGRALQHITNQSLPVPSPRERGERRLAQIAERWEAWHASSKGRSPDEWRQSGFARAALRVALPLAAPRNAPALLRALGNRRDHIRHNALVVLRAIAGPSGGPRTCAGDRLGPCWSRWWKRHGPAPPRRAEGRPRRTRQPR